DIARRKIGRPIKTRTNSEITKDFTSLPVQPLVDLSRRTMGRLVTIGRLTSVTNSSTSLSARLSVDYAKRQMGRPIKRRTLMDITQTYTSLPVAQLDENANQIVERQPKIRPLNEIYAIQNTLLNNVSPTSQIASSTHVNNISRSVNAFPISMEEVIPRKNASSKITHQDQSPFNLNYMQQPMPNPEDITDFTTAMNMALALMAKAFKINYSTLTNNNQRISSNPKNWQIAQPGMNMGQDRQMQMIGGNGGNQFRQYAGQNTGNLNGYNAVQNVRNQVAQNPRIQNDENHNQIRNGTLVAVRAEGNAAEHNGNQIRCYNF
nr:hypothetical protein [Tanacetum cinerariifolium]